MATSNISLMQRTRRELIIFLVLLAAGLILLPIAIYLVGGTVFGAYSGDGFGAFFRDLNGGLFRGQPVVYFLVLSPYLGVQLLRLTILVFRRTSPRFRQEASN